MPGIPCAAGVVAAPVPLRRRGARGLAMRTSAQSSAFVTRSQTAFVLSCAPARSINRWEGQMHSTTARLMYASLALAAVGIVAVSSGEIGAQAIVPSPLAPRGPYNPGFAIDVGTWVRSTPMRTFTCPTSGSSTALPPFFKVNGVYNSCMVDGPYQWDGKSWFVQRIHAFSPSGQTVAALAFDVIRVCSAGATHPPGSAGDGPCGPANVGPNGCEPCATRQLPPTGVLH